MGIDICVCFTEQVVPLDAITQSQSVQTAAAIDFYIVSGQARPESGHLAYFALWADEDFDLDRLCRELSYTYSPLCAVYRVDHSSLGGLILYQDSGVAGARSQTQNGYFELHEGIAQAFSRQIIFDNDDRLFFPALLIDEVVSCSYFRKTEINAMCMSYSTVIALLEGDLGVGPAFPF